MPITRQYAAGSIIYFAGDIGEDIYVLQQGRISLISTSLDQKEDIKEDVRRGEFFGVKSALGRYPREETAQVLADSRVLVFKLAEFEQFALKNTRIILQMLKVFSSQLRRVHKAVRELLGEHGVNDSSLELVRVGEYYFKAGKTDYALYAFNAYLKNYPGGPLAERARRRAQLVKEGAEYPMDLPDIVEEMQQKELALRTGKIAQQMPQVYETDQAMAGFSSAGMAPTAMVQEVPDLPDLPPPADLDLPLPDFDSAPAARTAEQEYNAGLSAFAAQNFQEAQRCFEQALSLAGGSDPALHEKILFELGRTHLKLNNARAAVEKFSEQLRSHGRGPLARKAMLQLAEIYERARDFNRAVTLYEKAAQIPPNDREAQLAQKKAVQLRGMK
ncbi:MAG: cyclic nucleotide-binding domain-containing protein [Turneriella sp.]|nr:cyclic nucleotide-binding domain-containing protein [Turneriella sp.]